MNRKSILISVSIIVFFIPFFNNRLYSQFENKLTQVVRLNPIYLNLEKIKDQKNSNGQLVDFCNEKGNEIMDSLDKLLNLKLSVVYVEKLFPMLGPDDSLSLGRQGQQVSIPPFWATFEFYFENKIQYFEYLEKLKKCYPFVIYNHPFFEVDFESQVNDTFFFEQLGLNNIVNPFADINIEEAWEISSGKSFIKVGVFDSGIDSTHEDLSVLTGCPCYESNAFIDYNFGIDKLGHGTSVAGIIAAKSNNSIGIAGIAGGGVNNEDGVSLIDFKLTDSLGTFSRLGIGVGLIDASRRVGTYYNWDHLDPLNEIGFINNYNPGYGINIANHSYSLKVNPFNRPTNVGGGVGDSIFIDDVDYPILSECYLCREAFLFSLKNGVVNVVSRGNRTNPNSNVFGVPKVPSVYDDSWIVSVGSSGINGDYINLEESIINGYVSYIGRNVDLIAPGTRSTVFTTKSTYLNNGSLYRKFNGTSAAAPHVTGVAALLLSKYNKPCYSNINLDPADVEYILQKSAKDLNSFEYDHYTGWGLLDAKKALDMISFPKLQIIHPIEDPIATSIVEIDTIHFYLNEPVYSFEGGPISQNFTIELNKNYKAVRYNVELEYDFSAYMTTNTQLIDTWIRFSQTNSGIYVEDTFSYLGYIGNTGQISNILKIDTFGIEPYAYIQSVDTINHTIKIRGYYYDFIRIVDNSFLNEVGDSIDFWYPINPLVSIPKMAYSIYILDTTLDNRYEFPCDSLNLMVDTTLQINEQIENRLQIYPNPTNDLLTLNGLDATLSGIITIFNLNGQVQFYEKVNELKTVSFDCSAIPQGIYMVEYRTENFKIVKKWIKL